MNKPVLYLALVILSVAAATLTLLHFKRAQVIVELAIRPGELSQSHAFLGNNCAACHTPVKGVEAKNCIVCHANERALLQRQPTAFHAEIGSCVTCHTEHQGHVARITQMDHAALTQIALKHAKHDAKADGAHAVQAKQLKQWLADRKGGGDFQNTQLKPEERLLDCATCHQTKDRHFGLFGTDCAQCHNTAKWTIAAFRHPPASSQSCAQCHQAPPSHYMEHFNMISKPVAQQEDWRVAECCGPVRVDQCYRCHQTTSWNDIKGVGFYKHH